MTYVTDFNAALFLLSLSLSLSLSLPSTLFFTLSSLPSLDNTELQVVARNHTTFGTDKIIGVALVSFSLVHREGNLTLGLSPSIPVSDRGQALLNVLSVRTNDDFAKEFVELKMNQQIVEDLTGQKEGN